MANRLAVALLGADHDQVVRQGILLRFRRRWADVVECSDALRVLRLDNVVDGLDVRHRQELGRVLVLRNDAALQRGRQVRVAN